jgi:hypothetical protein
VAVGGAVQTEEGVVGREVLQFIPQMSQQDNA